MAAGVSSIGKTSLKIRPKSKLYPAHKLIRLTGFGQSIATADAISVGGHGMASRIGKAIKMLKRSRRRGSSMDLKELAIAIEGDPLQQRGSQGAFVSNSVDDGFLLDL